MPSVEELSVTAVRSAMAPGYDLHKVAADLVVRARRNITALRMARARVERGAGWRSGPIGLRAREALTLAIELTVADAEIDLTEIDLTDRLERDLLSVDHRHSDELDDTLPA